MSGLQLAATSSWRDVTSYKPEYGNALKQTTKHTWLDIATRSWALMHSAEQRRDVMGKGPGALLFFLGQNTSPLLPPDSYL